MFVSRAVRAESHESVMGLLGIELGVAVAILWGAADILAAIAARRLRTFKTTYISQSMGLLMLLAFGGMLFFRWHLPLPFSTLVISALIGSLTGLCAALGYFAFYRALEIGPVALVSPISATSSSFTMLLSILILQEHLTPGRLVFVMLIIFGLIIASSSLVEARTLLKILGFSWWSQGVRWALVAMLAFGAMDFGIGASAAMSGWFLPVLWTRFFSILFLTLASLCKRQQKRSHAQGTIAATTNKRALSLSLPSLEEIARLRYPFSKLGCGVLLALLAGTLENAAVLLFSLDTRIATTGITSVIASSYTLFVMIFGMILYRERLAKNQLFGITMFMIGLALLAV